MPEPSHVEPNIIEQFQTAMGAQKSLRDASSAQAFFEFLNLIVSQKLPEIAAKLDENVVFEIRGAIEIPISGRVVGRDQVLARMLNNFSLFEHQKPTIEKTFATEHELVVIFREEGKYRNGNPYLLHAVQIWTVHDGKITSLFQIVDDTAHLEKQG